MARYCPRHIPIGLDDTRLKKSGKKIPNAFWSRDPLGPPFRANLLWGQRFLQASLLAPLYRLYSQSGPRGLPVRFEEVPAVRKPGKNAGPEAQAAYRRAQKAHHLSTAFVKMVQELRRSIDALGFASKVLIAVGDGSFCNQTTFRRGFERAVLLTCARKNLRLCFPYQGPGRRVYREERFTPEELYKGKSRPWKEVRLFHGGTYRRVRYKEVNEVLWRGGGACGWWCWRLRPTAKPKPAGLTTAKRLFCCATTRTCRSKLTSTAGKLKSTIGTKRASWGWARRRCGPS
jgi:hypothetical protein